MTTMPVGTSVAVAMVALVPVSVVVTAQTPFSADPWTHRRAHCRNCAV